LRKHCFLPILQLLCIFAYGQAPFANFTASQTSGCAPLVISFQDQSTGRPTQWRWDFGNGVTSTLQNPSTTYFSEGAYTVTLTVTNENGSHTLTRQGLITIFEKPVANFTVDRRSGCFPLSLAFSDSSVAGSGTRIVAWQWDFGNGVQSTEQSPRVRYNQAGSYSVALRVTNDKGCFASTVKPAYINVSGSVKAAFTNSAVDQCHAPFPVQFTNGSTGPGTLTYSWSFGDASGSDQKDPAHAYNASGTYSVSLAVSSSEGCGDTVRKDNLITIPEVSSTFTVPENLCVATPALFTSASTPAAQSNLWQFGDGTQATSADATKSYTTPGTYTVRLIKRFSHCSDTLTKSINVLPRSRSQFSATNRASCQLPLNVNFKEATPNAVSWFWDFGDGQTSTEQNPTHTYTNYGNYAVTLITTNSGGCSDTLRQAGFVQIRKPVVTIRNLPRSGCLPFATTFAADVNTVDQVSTYHWDFGDGGISSAASPGYTYTTPGSYPVSLTITTTGGCTETVRIDNAVAVGNRPTVDFTASADQTCVSQPVFFTATVSEADSWSWNFAGVTTSTLQNPTVSFPRPGIYTVSLTVNNKGCRETVTKQNFITVKPPLSAFSFTRDCISPRQYSFKDESAEATYWQWDFGDGKTSTEQHPVHTYESFGTFTVSLTTGNGDCAHTITRTVNILAPAISFAADRQVACKAATIAYTSKVPDRSIVASYNWDLGNGTSSTLANPQITYNTTGTYTVRLEITDIFGCKETFTQANYLRINGPTARFTASNNIGCAGLTAGFRDHSTTDGVNAITTWRWSYGDGTTESVNTAAERQHLYNNAGNYPVQLTVTDAAGCQDSLRIANLIRTSAPKAAFAVSDTTSCLGSTLQFTNQSTPQNVSSQWSFGNGVVSTVANPAYRYTDTGSFTVRLKVTDANGCTDSVTKTNYIGIFKTEAFFTVSDSIGTCTPYDVHFTNRSRFYTHSQWNFTNGTSTATSPSHSFFEAGTYPVTLYVTGRGGCVDSAKKTIVIFPDSATKITYTPIEGCKPVQLKASVSSPAKKTYTWDFGDGTLVETQATETIHNYQAVGNFLPRLILSDSGNCRLPFTGKDTVRIRGAVSHFGWDKQLFCDNGTVFFTDSTLLNDDGIAWQWNFGDGKTSTEQHPVHHYQQPGLYTVSLAVLTSSQCRDTVVHERLIKVVQSPSIDITGPVTLCKDESGIFNGLYLRQDTSAMRWSWQFPDGQFIGGWRPPARQYSTPGDFTITAVATNSSGCADTAAKLLTVHPLPALSLPAVLTSPVGTPVTIQPASYAPSVVSYLWSPADGLSCTTCPQPDARPKFNTTYQVLVTDSNGCRNSAQVQVVVFCENSNVFVPNTFSPNGDGSNDVFYIRGSGLASVKSLRIFNRWGELVFQRQDVVVNDAAAGWDGTFKGKALAPDTYVFQLEVFCENSQLFRFEGNIALIR
jgi:gliding motility-associated-like protein